MKTTLSLLLLLFCSCSATNSSAFINDLVGTNHTQYKVFEVNGQTVERRSSKLVTYVPYAKAPVGKNSIKFIFIGEETENYPKYITVQRNMNKNKIYRLNYENGEYSLILENTASKGN